jgi:hypothetical protein
MAGGGPSRSVDSSAGIHVGDLPGGTVMYHPETLRLLVRDRQQSYQEQARLERLARELTSSERQAPPERFSVRHLRWILFRPLGA